MKKRLNIKYLYLLLAIIIFSTAIPHDLYAVVELKEWSNNSSDVMQNKWDLPPQATFRTDHDEGVQNTDARFVGYFIDASGNTVLKGVYIKQQNKAEDWAYVSFKFDENLYDMIDFNKSFMLDVSQKPSYKFTKPTYPGASNTEMVVPFYNYDSLSNIKDVNFEFYLTLKPEFTWDNVVASSSHNVEMRTYNHDATKVLNLSQRSHSGPYTDDGYSSYTQSFAIIDSNSRREDYIYQIQPKRDNRVNVAGSNVYFMPEENKVQIVYQYSKNTFISGTGQNKAFYQYIYPDLLKYILPDENGVIGSLSIRDDSFNKIDINGETSHDVIITKDDLNMETDGGASIVIAENNFKSSNNLNIKRVPQDANNSYIYSNKTTDSDYTVIEYNVDTKKIQEDIVKNSYAPLPLSYSAMFLEDGNRQGYWQYTELDNNGVKVPEGTIITFETGTVFNNDRRAVNIQFGDNKALDFIYNVSPSDTVGQLKYYVYKDFFIPKGTLVKLVNPSGDLEQRFSQLTIVYNFPDKSNIKRPLRKPSNKIINKNYILANSDVLATGYASINEHPVIDEIFTDTSTVTGLVESPNTWANAEYSNDNSIARVFSYDNASNIPKDAQPNEIFALRQANSKVIKDKKIYSGLEFEGYTFELINNKELLKDMPITFTAKKPNNMASKKVVEQVQAKVIFDLNGQTSKIDGKNTIEKIAPLNKEYLLNNGYKPSGFGKIEGEELKNTENLKVVNGSNSIVTVTQNLTDKDGTKTTLNRQVINYIDHNGKNYQIDSKDEKIKIEEVDKLLKRQFPIDEEVNLPNAKRIIGWTTVKLEDKVVDGKTITVNEQFNRLLASNKRVRSIDDWEKARTEAYIYDELSPLEQSEKAYAVYGGLSLILHSGIKDENGNEITVSLPIEPKDIEYTDAKTKELDGTTSATMIFKKLPKAPYSDKKEDINNANNVLKDFKKENHTFIGWTLEGNLKDFKAGRNNQRISELLSGKIGENQKIHKETEGLTYLIQELQNPYNRNKKSYIPNGFDVAISSKDFDSEENFNSDQEFGLKTREQLLNNVSEIHLHAIYRPYFNIEVDPRYRTIDRTRGSYGEYVDNVPLDKKQPLTIGLLMRTAVTGYGDPTVDASANYNPVGDASTLKRWNPDTTSDLTWSLPGFDEYGRRKSYVSIVVPEGKEDQYVNFNNPFSEKSWTSLGISTFTKKGGVSVDPNAPKNLYRDADDNRDPYGVALAKIQSFVLGNDTQTGEIDAYTSATARKPLLVNNEVTGYNIVMTNALESLPAPLFDKVKNTDTQVNLDWKSSKDYESINKIEIYLDGDTYILTGMQGSFTSNDGSINAAVNNGKLTITGLDLKEKGGKDLQARYFTKIDTTEISGAIGSTRIIANKLSEPVNKMAQGVKLNNSDTPSLKFTVPVKTLDQVGIGSKYIAEKWTGTEWVRVGEKELTEADKVRDAYQGNEYTIMLNENVKVADDDIIRIVSYESNSDASYTIEEKQKDKWLLDGFSIPGYSATVPSGGREGINYITLDLKGPTGPITATDEKFRRFVNIEGQLEEIPYNQKVTLLIGDKQIEFDTKDAAISYINKIGRLDTMPDIKIIGVDRFGNVGETDVQYTKTYQTKVYVSDANRGRDFINVTSDMDGVEVTAIIYSKKTEVARGKATVATAKKNVEMDLLDKNGEYYALKRGDRIRITGVGEKDNKKYTSNPFDIVIK